MKASPHHLGLHVVEFYKGARQSGLVSVWQHTLVGQQLQGFLYVSGSCSIASVKLFC